MDNIAAGSVANSISPEWHTRWNGLPAQQGFKNSIARLATGRVRLTLYQQTGQYDALPVVSVSQVAVEGTVECTQITLVSGESCIDVNTYVAGVAADIDFNVQVVSLIS